MPRGRARRAAGPVVAVVALAACSAGDGSGAGREGSPVTVVGEAAEGYEATIRRTADGVPHITADGVPHITAGSVADLAFGQGWASGEDRACDLADQVLKIRGERARWFGRGEDGTNLHSDLAWRAVGLAERAAADWERASAEVRELITAYTAGWNAQLRAAGADGLRDWCAGAGWVRPLEPVEVYTYARSVSLFASTAQVLRYLASALPPATSTTSATDEAALGAALGSLERRGASNGWAVGADRSAEVGGLLVANPHFPREGELRFWEVHLTIPGELDIYGVQLSGLPGSGSASPRPSVGRTPSPPATGSPPTGSSWYPVGAPPTATATASGT